MENASKALLMAAGILLGIMILTTMIVLFTTFGDLGREYNEKLEAKIIQEFNLQFTKYENTELKAQDVLTLVELVKEWNNSGTNETIKMEVVGYNNINYQFLEESNNEINIIEGETTYKLYQITDINYSEITGRINSIEINELN